MRDLLLSEVPQPRHASVLDEQSEARRTDDRSECRYGVDRLVWLVRADGAVSCATMINVSRGGFGLRVSDRIATGERVLLRAGAGDVPAIVRWSTAERAGGIFARPDED